MGTSDTSLEESSFDCLDEQGVRVRVEKSSSGEVPRVAAVHRSTRARRETGTTRKRARHREESEVNRVTKVIAMASMIHMILLEHMMIVYTDAIERWDIKCMDQLPEYMKTSYKALLEVYEEMEQLLTEQGRQYRVEHAKKVMIRLAQAYLLEAKWTHENYKPTFEEFRANALPTSGYAMLAITAFVGMGDVVNPETFNWAANDPKIIRASTIICRFMDI
ncbi:hypothetical protein PTKIN_Ptkin11bG0166500 [Pterospermum kingtungense]